MLGKDAGRLALILLLAGCTPAPQYAPPTNAEAREAYKALVESQIADWKPAESSADIGSDRKINSIGEMAASVGSTAQLVKDVGTLASLRSNLTSFAGIKVSSCEWRSIDFEEADKLDRPANTDGIDYGYRCKIESFHRSSETPGAILAYDRTAYFWKGGTSFYYADVNYGPARFVKEDEIPQ